MNNASIEELFYTFHLKSEQSLYLMMPFTLNVKQSKLNKVLSKGKSFSFLKLLKIALVYCIEC